MTSYMKNMIFNPLVVNLVYTGMIDVTNRCGFYDIICFFQLLELNPCMYIAKMAFCSDCNYFAQNKFVS